MIRRFRCEEPFFSGRGKGDVAAFVEKYKENYEKAKQPVQPKIAYVYEGNIYVEDFEQNVLEDIHL